MLRDHVWRAPCGIAAVALLVCLLTACGLQVPADPHGTLDRARDGVMRVGVTENHPWVELPEAAEPAGIEPVLISGFAKQLNAEIEWSTASEAALLNALDQGELDIVVGGFLEDTPWVEKGATTLPYVETKSTGKDSLEKHVMIVRMGENGFLVALEKFLLAEAGS